MLIRWKNIQTKPGTELYIAMCNKIAAHINMMDKQEIFNRKLQVDMAYHSHHMKLIIKSYIEYLQALDSPKSTHVRLHSSLPGCLVDGSKFEPSY